jgi:putative inorganic carbon (HCO3(-)) transporter
MEKGLIFTYALTYGGAVVALFNPFYGLLVYICFAIIKPDAMWFWAVPQGNYSRIVAVALLVGWALHGFGRWSWGRGTAVILLLLAYWGWAALTAAVSPDPPLAAEFVTAIAKVVLPVLVGITTITSVKQLKMLAWVIVLSEGYLAFELNLSYYHGSNKVYEEGFAGSDSNCVAIAMVTCAGLAFFLALGSKGWWRPLLVFLCAALMAHVVMIARSRGGMLAMAITGVVAFCLVPKTPRNYALFALAAVIALRLAGPQVIERFSTTFASGENRDVSAASRLVLWRDCMDAALSHPVFGVGPDQWPVVAREQYGWVGQVFEAHSLWVQNAAELGFPGLILLLSFYFVCIGRLWPFTYQKYPVIDPWLHDAARMVIAALVGFMVAAQFVTIKSLETPYYIALLGAGVLKLSSLRPPAPVPVLGVPLVPAVAAVPQTNQPPVGGAQGQPS